MTEQQKAQYVKALMTELSYYERQGKTERAAQVKEELSRYADQASPVKSRATKRPAKKRTTR